MKMKNTVEMTDDEMGYFFGFARGTYGEVLDELSHTKVNSWRTSSIPLEQEGFNPILPATAEFERQLLTQGGSSLSVFVTHDLNLACYMAGRGIVTRFTARTWPGFLASVHVLQ